MISRARDRGDQLSRGEAVNKRGRTPTRVAGLREGHLSRPTVNAGWDVRVLVATRGTTSTS
jgi:hypothetical protein